MKTEDRAQKEQTEIVLRHKLSLELKRLRKQYGITVPEFAEHLGESGYYVRTSEKLRGSVDSRELNTLIKRLNDLHLERTKLIMPKVETPGELLQHITNLIQICIDKAPHCENHPYEFSVAIQQLTRAKVILQEIDNPFFQREVLGNEKN
jgi:hypothetical protein